MKSTILFLVAVVCCHKVISQMSPSAGYRSPSYTFQNIQGHTSETFTIGGSLNRPTILDFWGTGCASCITSLPRFDSAYKRFQGQVDFIVVARDHKSLTRAQKMFEKLRHRLKVIVPVVFDTASFRLFDVSSVPHYVWLNTSGEVAAVTDASALTTANVISLIRKGTVSAPQKATLQELTSRNERFDVTRPLLLDNNGGLDTNFLYRSVLSNWDPQVPQFAQSYMASANHHSVQVTGMLLSWLYQMAYGDTIPDDPLRKSTSYGKWWPKPILNLSDSSDFQFDFPTGKNLFTYSLILSPSIRSSPLRLQRILQKELFNYFGYTVTVEHRSMPCWTLEALPGATEKLRTKSILKVLPFGEHTGGRFTRITMQELVAYMWVYQQKEPPIIDRTGIDFPIDITIEALMTDFSSVQQALLKNGLRLKREVKEMKVIVISDHGKPFKNSYTTR